MSYGCTKFFATYFHHDIEQPNSGDNKHPCNMPTTAINHFVSIDSYSTHGDLIQILVVASFSHYPFSWLDNSPFFAKFLCICRQPLLLSVLYCSKYVVGRISCKFSHFSSVVSSPHQFKLFVIGASRYKCILYTQAVLYSLFKLHFVTVFLFILVFNFNIKLAINS